MTENWGNMLVWQSGEWEGMYECEPGPLDEEMTHDELLAHYRRMLDSIHDLGDIFYDKGRLEAYSLIAHKASEMRARREGKF